MRQFSDIDPRTIAQDPRVVASIQKDSNPNITYYFLVDGDYLIFATADFFTNKRTGESEWLHYQIEFPKQGLVWFLESMQYRFFKTEAEGGLPKGVFHDITTIDSESIALDRDFNADGNRGGGYSFATLDRKEDGYFAKEYSFTDEFLFNGGLIEILQDIADKIQRGEL